MRYWLMKSEPTEFSFEDLAARPAQTAPWFGVRNYQARNFMRDQMAPGDQAFFYHSGCAEPGIAGLIEVSRKAYPDETQFDPSSPYFDPRATRGEPRWVNVDVRLLRAVAFLPLRELRRHEALARMRVLQTGNRLSITPVDPREWRYILDLPGMAGGA